MNSLFYADVSSVRATLKTNCFLLFEEKGTYCVILTYILSLVFLYDVE